MKPSEILIVTLCISITLAEQPQVSVFKDTQTANERIIGGSNATRRQFPYQVSLHYKLIGHVCGGSILTQEWVLTAGHCVVNVDVSDLKIVAGLLNQGENHPDVQTVDVSEQYIHPRYPDEPIVASNDIALLRLSSPLQLTPAVQPISLPQENEEFTGEVLLSGWGRVIPCNKTLPTTLQYIKLQIVAYKDCYEILQKIVSEDEANKLDKSMICVFEEGRGSCNGDSGGPMVQNGKLLGVSSWGVGPCGLGPSVYTKVSNFIPFIKKYINDL